VTANSVADGVAAALTLSARPFHYEEPSD